MKILAWFHTRFPVNIADWSKPLSGFTVSRMSRTGGHDVAGAMRVCGISIKSQTHPICKHPFSALPIDKMLSVEAQIGLLLLRSFCPSSYWVWNYSIHVPGWLLKWLNLITAHGSVSKEPGSVTWLATKYLKTVSWRNHTEKLTTLWPQNISFWPKNNIPSSYFTILMLNCLENTLKL